MRTVRFCALPNDGLATTATIQEAVAPWLRRNPSVRVELSVRTEASMWGSLFRHLKAPRAAAEDEPRPDLVQLPSHWTAAFAGMGFLEELAGAGEALCGLPGPLKPHAGRGAGGGVFSLPWWMEVPALYYRRDFLAACGLEPDSLATWEGFAEACRRLEVLTIGRHKALTGDRAVYPVANHNPRESVDLADVAPLVWARGGDFFSADGARCLLHRPEFLEGTAARVELLRRGWMPLLGRSGLVPEGLFDGRCAMQFHGRLPPAGLAPRVGRNLRARPCPGGPSGVPSGLVTAWSLAVARGTPAGEDAAGLARYLCGPAASAAYAESIRAFPCSPSWDRRLVDGSVAAGAMRASFASARVLPNLPATGTLERLFRRCMDRVVRDILRGSYSEGMLRRELACAAGELDHILSTTREAPAHA